MIKRYKSPSIDDVMVVMRHYAFYLAELVQLDRPDTNVIEDCLNVLGNRNDTLIEIYKREAEVLHE